MRRVLFMILVGTFYTTTNIRGHILLHRGVLKYVTTTELRDLYRAKKVSNIEMYKTPMPYEPYTAYDIIPIKVKITDTGNQSFAKCKKECMTPSLVVLCAKNDNDKVVRFWDNCKYYTLGYSEFFKYLKEYSCARCNFTIIDGKIEESTEEHVALLKDYTLSKIESVSDAWNTVCQDMLGMYKFTFGSHEKTLVNNSSLDDSSDFIYACYLDKDTRKFTFYRMYKNGVREKANFTSGQKKYLMDIFNNIISHGKPY